MVAYFSYNNSIQTDFQVLFLFLFDKKSLFGYQTAANRAILTQSKETACMGNACHHSLNSQVER